MKPKTICVATQNKVALGDYQKTLHDDHCHLFHNEAILNHNRNRLYVKINSKGNHSPQIDIFNQFPRNFCHNFVITYIH